jgi:hypothetical protein
MMISFRQPDEIPDLPNAGRQFGDINLLRTEVLVHFPDCVAQRDADARITACTCAAKFVKTVTLTSGTTL